MNLIVVVDKKWGIGRNNDLLFRLKKDMAFFKSMTVGKTVVMGARTFDGFPKGALPNRVNVVLDDSGKEHKGAVTVSNADQLRTVVSRYDDDSVFVIGGASVYRLLLNCCKTAYVTKADADGNADVFFPNLDEMPNWKQTERSEKILDGDYLITFCKYENNDVRNI